MSDFKNRKLLVNIQEFDKSGTRYQINGVDLNKAIFFWRKSQEMYDVIPKGSYKIVEEGGNIYLEIIDVDIYAKIERLQVCYEFASLSSTYDVDFNVDITTLKDRYNEAVADIKAIYGYVEKNMFTADGLDVSVVLPQLNTGEVWMKVDGGYKGFSVGDIELNIKDFWIEFNEKTAEILKEIELDGNAQVDRVEDAGDQKLEDLDNKAIEVDNKLELIWRMYSVITGTNRYLSGGQLSDRNPSRLERDVDGGLITARTGDPDRIYNGGSISDRAIIVGLNIDLGGYGIYDRKSY